MSAEVRNVLGVEGARKVVTAPLAQARCPVCGAPVPPAGPVNVVLSVGRDEMGIVVTFCHTGCSPSTLRGADFDLSDMLPAESAMRMTSLLLPHGGAELPVLVAERPLHAWHSPGGGAEATDLLVATLLAHGFTLIPRLRDAPRVMLPLAAELAHAEAGLSRLLIETAPGELFYEGTVNIPPGWRAAAQRYGWCVLYSGNHLSDPVTEDITMPLLKAAASAGSLVGARLRITWTDFADPSA